jgi:hypothetical protein
MLWMMLTMATFAADAPAVDVARNTIEPVGDQWLATSPSFVVRNFHPAQDARHVAQQCEKWRDKLHKYWTAEIRTAWPRRCEVTVHSCGASYVAAVGPGAQRTFGSSNISFSSGKKVTGRAIDVRGDDPRGTAALPHEMTHVVLADLLDGRQPPRWADEGMAILADSTEKQMLHERDLTQGLSRGTAFRVAELLVMEGYPQAGSVAAFYGQSASLTACLAKRDDPARFIAFLRRALDAGYDQALREVYKIQNVAQLERHWHEQRLASNRGHHGVRLALAEPKAHTP